MRLIFQHTNKRSLDHHHHFCINRHSHALSDDQDKHLFIIVVTIVHSSSSPSDIILIRQVVLVADHLAMAHLVERLAGSVHLDFLDRFVGALDLSRPQQAVYSRGKVNVCVCMAEIHN